MDELRSIGAAAGLTVISVAAAEPFLSARADLHERREAGLDGGMQFTYRRPERSTDPASALPGATSLVVGARRYPGKSSASPPGPSGAWPPTPDPTTTALRDALGRVASRLEADGWRTRMVADDNVGRPRGGRARRAGVVRQEQQRAPSRGRSWFVLGTVITDAPLPSSSRLSDGCGPCRRCLDGCPTGAIVAPGVVDARRCLAWLVQAPGSIPEDFRPAIGDRMYGCDDCQEVCPPNRAQIQSDASAEGRPGPVLDVLGASDDELLTSYGRWYIPERNPRYLRRNALVVLGNVGSADDERVVRPSGGARTTRIRCSREHARWAARRLGMEAREELI